MAVAWPCILIMYIFNDILMMHLGQMCYDVGTVYVVTIWLLKSRSELHILSPTNTILAGPDVY